jgi:hypothetical protein
MEESKKNIRLQGNSPGSVRKPYEKPELQRLGGLRELTASGSGKRTEDAPEPGDPPQPQYRP